MKFPANILQQRLYERLSGINHNAKNVPFYDYVPDTIDPPFLNYISDTFTDDSSKNDYSFNTTVTLEVVTAFTGRKSANEITDSVLQALITDSTAYPDLSPDFKIYHIQLDNAFDQHEDTQTGTLLRKILRFRFLIQQL